MIFHRSLVTLNSSTENVQKITRLAEDHGDLQGLIDNLGLGDKARKIYLYDHVNIASVINYQAVATVIHWAVRDPRLVADPSRP